MPSAIVMLVKPVQPLNADSPIEVTPFGIVIFVKAVQPINAALPILVTLPSAGIALVLQPTISVLVALLIIQFPELLYTGFL